MISYDWVHGDCSASTRANLSRYMIPCHGPGSPVLWSQVCSSCTCHPFPVLSWVTTFVCLVSTWQLLTNILNCVNRVFTHHQQSVWDGYKKGFLNPSILGIYKYYKYFGSLILNSFFHKFIQIFEIKGVVRIYFMTSILGHPVYVFESWELACMKYLPELTQMTIKVFVAGNVW